MTTGLGRSGAATWLLALTTGATVLMICIISAVRVGTTIRRRRRSQSHRAAMQLLLRVTDGEHVAAPTDRRLSVALGRAAAQMVHKVRGADRQALADWLTASGYRDAARRAMSSRWATRRARAIELYLAATSGTEPGPVVAMLRDRHLRVRATAVRALGDAGARDAVPALVAAVGARKRPISTSAAAMAIVHAAPSTAASLETAWRSRDPRVRQLAIDISGHLALADARSELERVLTSPDGMLRTHAARALEQIGSPRSISALRTARRGAVAGSVEQSTLDHALGALGDVPGDAPGDVRGELVHP